MTERKPPGASFESWVDKQISDAVDRGEFDNVPGAGKPIANLDKPYDEVWVAGLLRREGVSTEDMLPTPLRLRKEIERLPETVRKLRSEEAVRDVVAELNQRILAEVRLPSGPPIPVAPVKVDAVVARWRDDREAAALQAAAEAAAREAAAPSSAPRVAWWRRIARRRAVSRSREDHTQQAS